MKSLTAFSQVILKELGDRCHTSTEHDCNTVVARVRGEGLSFLTITLPAFGKGLQKALSDSQLTPAHVPGFRFRGGLPVFLRGFLELVFDSKTGVLLASPSHVAIAALHEFCSLFGKVEIPCSDTRLSAAWKGFVECEEQVRYFDSIRTPDQYDRFSRMSTMLFGSVFTEVDRQVYYREILPRHGSGATAERLTSNGKYDSLMWTRRLEEVFPFGEFLFPNWNWYHQFEDVDLLEPGSEIPVRVISVPKTLKAPRIIAIEPTPMQYVQQGLRMALEAEIYRDDLLNNLIGNRSQIPNREMARRGSIDGSLATLDLSEASDRVSNQLVRTMLRITPHLQKGVDACRSRSADVPSQGVVRLAKFASMGSALCFTMEAMVFITIVFLGIEKSQAATLSRSSLKKFVGRVRVYGDDIIVPSEMMQYVACELEAFGLKVNTSKSFGTGKFRESCGGDYYDGTDITPVKVRSIFPTRRTHVTELQSTISLRNQLYTAGYTDAVSWLDSLIRRVLPDIKDIPVSHSGMGLWTTDQVKPGRVHPSYHVPQIKVHAAIPLIPKDFLDGRGALMKYFLKRSDLPFQDVQHLSRAGRPCSVDIKTRWANL